MNIVELSEWLKSTIPGIILLGAVGSIIGSIIIYFSIKLFKSLTNAINVFFVRLFGDNFFKLIVFYMRLYYKARSLLFQLKEKEDQIPLLILHQRVLADRNLIFIIAFVLVLITTLLFIFTGALYPKTAVFLVSLSIIFVHDALFVSYWAGKIEKHFYGLESDFSKYTYDNKDTVICEIFISAENRISSRNEK
ncbi:hypothetical protein [Vibrio cholerae]|uniref:hypothetical protein n=1 Tax=Vibrio cholerae TaxID=666 RepID=UPI00307FD2A9